MRKSLSVCLSDSKAALQNLLLFDTDEQILLYDSEQKRWRTNELVVLHLPRYVTFLDGWCLGGEVLGLNKLTVG